ncbi:hypothetical protein [Paracoccus alkenifer]|uniref:Uncharacterized protein n=1 Tax=Paracoccus alkenifer TaxID=65735 RepID=A0A1H6N622_9RHOB|nr:hypothetical protein [Paracoccus alkenifer]SEI10142.1 hypothetical protein SAMN04488075_2873 [Paracoccus alkenifer]
MALTYPYPLADFCDGLRAISVVMTLRRHDEQSGGGDGRFWTAELAPPLWSAEVALAARPAPLARELDARIDGLNGSSGTFLFSDPSYRGPAGGSAGLTAVTLSGISADRGAVALAGLPAGFVITAGDFLSIDYGPGRVYFGRFAEGAVANGSGAIAQREIRPHLPMTITAGAAVELARPRFKAFIPPGGYKPFNYVLPHGEIAVGASLSILQKP